MGLETESLIAIEDENIPFEILYEDDELVAINKPYGYFVHRTFLNNTAKEIALYKLRDQIGKKVYPVHRLDRKTSGVLVYALNSQMLRLMNDQFMNAEVEKEYIAIVRGYTDDEVTIDYAITNDRGKLQEAVTVLHTLQKSEIPLPHGKFQTSRYSLVRLIPQTGRMHQLRKHTSHIFHPIIGDRPHGCNKQNKLFLENFNLTQMMLHAKTLSFQHPTSEKRIAIKADYSDEFKRIASALQFKL